MADKNFLNELHQDLYSTVNTIYESFYKYSRMYCIYSWISRAMKFLSTASFIYSLIYPLYNYGLVLSLACFTLNSIFDFNKEKRILEKLVRLYNFHIIPDTKQILNEFMEKEYDESGGDSSHIFSVRKNIENVIQSNYLRFMGDEITPSIDCVGILCCTGVYCSLFIAVPILHHFVFSFHNRSICP